MIEHLIVGVLLLTPLLALLPTTAIFYCFFLVLYLMCLGAKNLLLALSAMLLKNPLYFAAVRLFRPGLMPGTRQLLYQGHSIEFF